MGFPRTSGRPIEKVTHLGTAAKYWPTPTRSMIYIQDMEMARFAGGDPRRPRYGEAFPTPIKRDYRSPKSSSRKRDGAAPLVERIGGQLNPYWVEWLMGWPIGWTSLGAVSARMMERWLDDAEWWIFEPNIPRVARGIKDRVSRLKAIGNGQVPHCVAAAWLLLTMEG